MKHTRPIRGMTLPAMTVAVLLTGCAASSPPPLYQWTGYQPAVYDYLKRDKDPQQQIDALEKALQEIRAKGATPPPGFHAQLGMLYASVGKDGPAMEQFGTEKDLFPESSTYMDFLMKHKTQQP
ncbi:hypothetical protein CI15_19580 [Paraburkholderia monticola]|uniref:DUF4810 domain-containing protein n=1 Tax=Paraburkholderia monticola TaxID=1399968 RepID=A0A149PJX8_9BURK|nr:DUF4810 domain-containing protein [Paraburkholderia monticola]KXU85381.1 hypothetical protein CI15_19580 [Paraburkholderia monticola]